MIIVTGTKRSGTSMWMQILAAAGFPVFGEAFPRDWGATIRDANPDGFYESILRRGIYHATNPHPKTGAFFRAEEVEGHVVKVFIPGLVRTDPSYIGWVIASVRHWREYERSLTRLYALEEEGRRANGKSVVARVHMPPILEWWQQNYGLLRDAATRGYRVHFQSYDGLLAEPREIVARALSWLGSGDLESAVAAIKPENRTQRREDGDEDEPGLSGEIDASTLEVFDLLYDTIDRRKPLTRQFIETLNTTNKMLSDRVKTARARVTADAARRRTESRSPENAG